MQESLRCMNAWEFEQERIEIWFLSRKFEIYELTEYNKYSISKGGVYMKDS